MKRISIRLGEVQIDKLDELASAQGRSRDAIVNEALHWYFDRQDWIVEAIKEGIRDADAGNLVPHEQVMAEINSIIEARRK